MYKNVLTLLTFIVCTASIHAAKLLREPYLQSATPNSIVIVWRTTGMSKPMVKFGTELSDLNSTVTDTILTRVSHDVAAEASIPRLYQETRSDLKENKAYLKDPKTYNSVADTEAPPQTYQFEATLYNLKPNRRYYYAVYDDQEKLAGEDSSYFFKTLPEFDSDLPQRLLVIGDSGRGKPEQYRTYESMLKFVEDSGRPLDMYIHVGDMAYSHGTDKQFQEYFFEPYARTLRNTTCWPVMGNHEGHTARGLDGIGPYYDAYVLPTKGQSGGLASGTEAYYSYKVGKIHFICLDSHDLDRNPNGSMARWLKADLEAAQADWLIAIWHHPAYTKGSHDSDKEQDLTEMRSFIMPIIDEGGVDLVLTGHSHIYERSMLVDGAYATPTVAEGVILDDGDGRTDGDGAYKKSKGLHAHEGTVQVVAGHGGGGTLKRVGTMPIMREIILEFGSVIIDIDGDTLNGKMINEHGQISDHFSIIKRGKVSSKPVVKPWQPKALEKE